MLQSCSPIRLASLACFLALNFFDAITTYLGIRIGLSEANRIPALLLDLGGEWAMYLFKVLIVLLLVGSILRLSVFYRRLWHALHTSNALLALVVLANTASILAVL